jgi:hypothetical protein
LTGDLATDGGFFLVGFTYLPEKREGGALLIKIDSEAQTTWSKHFFYRGGSSSLGYTVVATPDGGCVLTGHTSTQAQGDLNAFLARVGGQGE